MTEIQVIPGGTPKWTRDAALNDSDKSFTVPTGKVWDVQTIHAELVCTATVGNRLLQMIITDGTNNRFVSLQSNSITANQYGSLYFENSLTNVTAITTRRLDNSGNDNVTVSGPLPMPFFLPAGYVIRIYDAAAIDAAADDLTVLIHYIEYEA